MSAPRLTIRRPDLALPRRRDGSSPTRADLGFEPPSPEELARRQMLAPLPPLRRVVGAWGLLLHRLRAWRALERSGLGAFALAPPQVRRARLAICRPEHCPSAVAVPGSTRARCSAKGCGCDDLHAVRADAVCPRGRWSA
jgi:hypothetical protein